LAQIQNGEPGKKVMPTGLFLASAAAASPGISEAKLVCR
jgi:hypothetical protein